MRDRVVVSDSVLIKVPPWRIVVSAGERFDSGAEACNPVSRETTGLSEITGADRSLKELGGTGRYGWSGRNI